MEDTVIAIDGQYNEYEWMNNDYDLNFSRLQTQKMCNVNGMVLQRVWQLLWQILTGILSSGIWWKEPEFLFQSYTSFPNSEFPQVETKNVVLLETENESVIKRFRFPKSSWTYSLRVITKEKQQIIPLTQREHFETEIYILKVRSGA